MEWQQPELWSGWCIKTLLTITMWSELFLTDTSFKWNLAVKWNYRLVNFLSGPLISRVYLHCKKVKGWFKSKRNVFLITIKLLRPHAVTMKGIYFSWPKRFDRYVECFNGPTDVGNKASLLEFLLVIFTLDMSQDAISRQLTRAARN